jgi:hypothetical protein
MHSRGRGAIQVTSLTFASAERFALGPLCLHDFACPHAHGT